MPQRSLQKEQNKMSRQLFVKLDDATFQVNESFKVCFIGAMSQFSFIFELFCLQNSLIVSMQPQVSGKVGSLVGFWLDHIRHSR